MKIVYIAHPIGGAVEENIKHIFEIIKDINLVNPNIVPFAPYIADIFALDDSDPNQRERGIKNDHYLLRKGFIDEVWLFGHKISPGMRDEIRIADETGIPVYAKSIATLKELTKLSGG